MLKFQYKFSSDAFSICTSEYAPHFFRLVYLYVYLHVYYIHIFSIPLGKNSDLHLIKLILFYWHNGKTYDEQQGKNKENRQAYMTAAKKMKKNKTIENSNEEKGEKQQEFMLQKTL